MSRKRISQKQMSRKRQILLQFQVTESPCGAILPRYEKILFTPDTGRRYGDNPDILRGVLLSVSCRFRRF